MSKATTNARYEYEHTHAGKLQAYIRRFHNIKELKDAFEQSEHKQTVTVIQNDLEESIKKLTEDFSGIEKTFREEKAKYETAVNDKLVSMLEQVADILKEFEKNYGK
jgi:2-phosphoglycerate kinase